MGCCLGAPSHNGKRRLGTRKQPFLVVLSTERENQYSLFVKLKEMTVDSGENIEHFFDQYVVMSQDRKQNMDGISIYNILKAKMQVQNEKIDYDQEEHRLYFLNKIASSFNHQLLHVFHSIGKRMLPLYYAEYEWRFNHRKSRNILEKIRTYICQSSIATRKMIRTSMDLYADTRGLQTF
ncbi:transposase [Faecalicoccus pleomorphus]|uniref:transposase n=1 Tax=Faecalicoccus pleomorphus TaxID=1323 RepID=UPI0025A4BACD|nr:transposase [Faecalicoccus pleomorphus]MDM8292073.1 transposase [Faecalicoccus pleomorphus]